MKLSSMILAASLTYATSSFTRKAPETSQRRRRRTRGKEPTIEGIVNGNELNEFEKPEYLVSLGTMVPRRVEISPGYSVDFQYFVHNCGGSLISPYLVLTAAHCFYSGDEWSPIGYVDFNLYDRADRASTGTINMLLRDRSKNGNNIKIHPDFNLETLDMDVALIILDEPIYGIEPVTLNKEPQIPASGDSLFLAGWGYLHENLPPYNNTFDLSRDIPNVPNYFEPWYVPNRQCVGRNEWPPSLITKNKLCTLGDEVDEEDAWNPKHNRQALCRGDSGGPLIMEAPEGDVQVGIVSFTEVCGHKTIPDVYARVSSAYDWINDWIEIFEPSAPPTMYPTSNPTSYPTSNPTSNPISNPTLIPTNMPSVEPTSAPSDLHSKSRKRKKKRGKMGKGKKRPKAGKSKKTPAEEMIPEEESMSFFSMSV